MQVIWKYILNPGYTTHHMPSGQILSVANQEGNIVLWVIEDPKYPLVERRFFCAMTGEEFDQEDILRFIGTVILIGSPLIPFFVVHVFETLRLDTVAPGGGLT